MLMLMMAVGGYFLWLGLQTARQVTDRIPLRPNPQINHAAPGDSPLYRNSVGMEFILVADGEINMGSQSDRSENPVHRVRITRPFYLGKYEVTQGEWAAVMGSGIEAQRNKLNPDWAIGETGPRFPMYYVTWEDAIAFVNRLNKLERTNIYRLPTEAEWKYACRASAQESIERLEVYAWFGENAGESVHTVGQKRSNAWGLFDTHGNVAE